MKYPLQIQQLIDHFAQLPTVGPKTAERYVFYLLKQPPQVLANLAKSIADLKQNLVICSNCQAIGTASPCLICSDQQRQSNLLCIVADTRDMLALEQTRTYHGYYHVLGGTLETIKDWNLQKLTIKQLTQRLENQPISEVILALNPDVAGETTSLYLTKILKQHNITITKLAQGLPIGANLEYADPATLSQALKYRNKL